jgi:hypothetical protein
MSREQVRVCGSCSLCCKLPYVPAVNKPIDTWCRHCNPGRDGCRIYATRPDTCRDFICGWLGDLSLGDEWFPARCKMMISKYTKQGETRLLITVDPTFPDAWRREPHYSHLRVWADPTPVTIRIGRRLIELSADGAEREETATQAFIEGRPETALHQSPALCGKM